MVNFQISSFSLTLAEPRVYTSEQSVSTVFYEQLAESFPIVELQNRMQDNFFAAIESERDKKEFKRLLNGRNAWRSLYREVTSPKFRQLLLQQFQSDLEEIRGTVEISELYPHNTEVKCGFHLSRNGYLLSPHTDTGRKIITIVIYFGDTDQPLSGAGTRFYKSRNSECGKKFFVSLLDDDDRQEFERDDEIVGVSLSRVYSEGDVSPELEEAIRNFDSIHDCVYESTFLGNRAILFMKSNTSWHDVRLTSLEENQLRASFIINLSYSTGRFGGSMDKLKVLRRKLY